MTKKKSHIGIAEVKLRAEEPAHFPVVGIGASAGGFAAVRQLLAELPDDTGMAFVLVQHLNPAYHSNLAELLDKATRMPVLTIENGMPIHQDKVYVIPPGQSLLLEGRTLKLLPRDRTTGPALSIDHFFLSLAKNLGEACVGVVLSGTGSDGSKGLKAIKTEGGITFAQDEQTAEFPEMPRHAVNAGCVDLILSPQEIGRELTRLAHHPLFQLPRQVAVAATETLQELDKDVIERILDNLKALGIDFVGYKRSTVSRRILRRMAINKLSKLNDYADFLCQHPEEAAALNEDMLIKVTSFFRDPGAFDALKLTVYPTIVQGKGEENPVRIWVPGCATGQEVYSIAMSLLDFLRAQGKSVPIQVFGTDISEQAINKARSGLFTRAEVAELNPAQLHAFFNETRDGFQVKKAVRELCIFARQDFTHDPPFSRLDLVSCRNVLIYFGSSLQKKVLPLFHYALNPGGFLLLGASESIGSFDDLFTVVNKRNRIFCKKVGRQVAVRGFEPVPVAGLTKLQPPMFPTAKGHALEPQDLQTLTDKILLRKYHPVAVVFDRELNILHFRGDTGPYLQPMPGKASLSLLKMVHDDLRMELRTLIHSAQKIQMPQRREGLRIDLQNKPHALALEVTPFSCDGDQLLYLLQFEPMALPEKADMGEAAGAVEAASVSEEELLRLRQDLYSTREYMQTLIEDREKSLEDIKIANEEILSSNEELQSINEELETAKEELESSNEELSTVNAELQARNSELSQSHGDLRNLLLSAQIPFVIIEEDLRIRLVSPNAEATFNVGQGDVGRPISALNLHLSLPGLEEILRKTIRSGESFEQEIMDRRDFWNLLRIRPYKTIDGKIEGAVITLFDIDRLKKSMEEIESAHKYALRIVDTIKDPLLVLDRELRVRAANPAFYEKFQAAPHQTEGQSIFALGSGQWNNPDLRRLLEEILPKSAQMDNFQVKFDFPHLGPRSMLLSARRMRARESGQDSILLGIQDATERLLMEDSLRQAKRDAEKASQAKSEFLATMSHEIRTPMTTIIGVIEHLMQHTLEPQLMRCLDLADNAAESLMELLGDILDFSRIEADKLTLNMESFDLRNCITDAVDILRLEAEKKGLAMKLDISAEVPRDILGDHMRLRQILVNLVGNAIKFTEQGEVAVCVGLLPAGPTGTVGASLQFSVRDTGIGIPPGNMEKLFQSFTQVDSSNTRKYGGVGLGLSICKGIVERMGGSIKAESRPGQGTTFTFTIPLQSAPEKSERPAAKAGTSGDLLVNGRPPRILLGEDDASIREVVEMQTAAHNWEIVSVCDGRSVVETWQNGDFDMILMDLQMPELDGCEATRLIRSEEQTTGRHVPILALTAHAGEESEQLCLASGMDGYLVKPLRLDQFYATIERYLKADVSHPG